MHVSFKDCSESLCDVLLCLVVVHRDHSIKWACRNYGYARWLVLDRNWAHLSPCAPAPVIGPSGRVGKGKSKRSLGLVGMGGAGYAAGGEEQRHWSRRKQAAPRRGNK